MYSRTSNRFSSEDSSRVRVRINLMAVSVSRSSPLKRPLPREALPVFSVLNNWAWPLTSPLRWATGRCLLAWISPVSFSPVLSALIIVPLSSRQDMGRVSSVRTIRLVRWVRAIRPWVTSPSSKPVSLRRGIRQVRFRQGSKPVPWRLPEPLLLTCRLTNRRSLMSRNARLFVPLKHSVLR